MTRSSRKRPSAPSVCHYGESHEEQTFCTRAHVAPDVRTFVARNDRHASAAPCRDSDRRACPGEANHSALARRAIKRRAPRLYDAPDRPVAARTSFPFTVVDAKSVLKEAA